MVRAPSVGRLGAVRRELRKKGLKSSGDKNMKGAKRNGEGEEPAM